MTGLAGLRVAALAALAMLACAAGHAALWGYVDADGVAHFAERQLDSRYTLVFADAGGASASAPAGMPRVPGKTSAPGHVLTWLEIAPEVKRVQPWVREAAQQHGVDRELINALIAVESGFDDKARSPKGAVGLMQLMPSTAQRLMPGSTGLAQVAQQLAEPRTNIAVGTRLLAQLLKRHRRIDLALAAWNAGSGAVRRSGGKMPANAETRAHVHQVLELYWALLQQRHSRDAVTMKLNKP